MINVLYSFERGSELEYKRETYESDLPFVIQYQPSVPNRQILMRNWHAYNRTTTITERNLQKSVPLLYKREQLLKD